MKCKLKVDRYEVPDSTEHNCAWTQEKCTPCDDCDDWRGKFAAIKGTRENNLKIIKKVREHFVQVPGFKKGMMPEQFAVLYASRHERIYDTMHVTDECGFKAMLKSEVYGQARVYDLDTGDLIEHVVKPCPCDPDLVAING